MTPAIELVKKQKIEHSVHQFEHNTGEASYGVEAAKMLAVPSEMVFKTLVVETDSGSLAVCVVPVITTLNLKLAAKGLNVKKVKMAEPAKVQRVTGYVLGGVSPLAQKRQLPTLVDISAKQFSSIFVSAGKRGLELEICPHTLVDVCQGKFVQIEERE